MEEEKIWHDKAFEKFTKDYNEYEENRQKLLDWEEKREQLKGEASENLSDADKALELYAQVHPRLEEPKFSDYYRPSSEQTNGEMIFVGGGMLALGFITSKFV